MRTLEFREHSSSPRMRLDGKTHISARYQGKEDLPALLRTASYSSEIHSELRPSGSSERQLTMQRGGMPQQHHIAGNKPPKSSKRLLPYCWGEVAFPVCALPAAWALSATLLTLVHLSAPTSGPAIDQGMTLQAVRGTVLVTVAQLLVFYNAIGGQTSIKMVYGNLGARAENIATRTMMNTLEQQLPFLVLLWLHAAYVDAAYALLQRDNQSRSRRSVSCRCRHFLVPSFEGVYHEFTCVSLRFLLRD